MDAISKKALLEHARIEANRDGGDFERWTILAGKVISGEFDLPSPAEERYRTELEELKHLVDDEEGMRIINEVLSPIGEQKEDTWE